ncbi:MAG: penicillin-binding protein 1A [Pseudomonadota bacterium]
MKVFRLRRFMLYLLLAGVLVTSLTVAVLTVKVASDLPSIESLRDVQLQVPLRIYTRDRRLLAEFGEKRRNPVRIDEVPEGLIQAFLAAEDDRFYEHPGVDLFGLMRAVFELIRTGEKRQGGSTITMQVARNFYLSREKTYLRKLSEIILAFRIEQSLSKDKILELYLNKIYLGHHAYGVEAAARVYYGVGIDELSAAQTAMIAALPKAPSRVNPVNNPAAATIRRNYILGRMHKLGFIDTETYAAARAEPDTSELHTVQAEARAPWLAEMVRDEMINRFGPAIYTSGYSVVTTLHTDKQAMANSALQTALLEYSRRHGYHGPEGHVELDSVGEPERLALLRDYPTRGGLLSGLVVAVAEKSVQVLLRKGETVALGWDGLSWAQPYKTVNRKGKAPKKASDILAAGDVIRLEALADDQWRLAQVPKVQGALVSVRPEDGAIMALVGGFDFNLSKFNRVTQARRQPGSSFKPVVYSAALETGFTPASIINDAPVVFDDAALEDTWRPENYSGKFYGPTRLREALFRSRNLVSIRILRSIGARTVADYAERFGFSKSQLPRDLTLALGSASATPLQMARAFAVFANGGYRVKPYFIQRIQDVDGNVIEAANPVVVCPGCPAELEDLDGNAQALPLAPAVITPQNAWLMDSMMRDVIQRGTGQRARALGRTDIAGKTGTTNDQNDAWFCGYNPALVAVAWVGFDKLDTLGRRETGGRAALPMWMSYMGSALKGTKSIKRVQPKGLVTVRIDSLTGLLARSSQAGGIFETFREDNVPGEIADGAGASSGGAAGGDVSGDLF